MTMPPLPPPDLEEHETELWGQNVYAHPPQQRKPLTEERIDAIPFTLDFHSHPRFAETLALELRRFTRAVERAHDIKETP